MLSFIFSLKSLLLKICASDEDPLDPTLTQRNLYSALTRASNTKRKALVVVIVLPDFFDFFMTICLQSVASTAWGTFHLVLNFSTFLQSSGLVRQHKYSSWNLARMAHQTWGMNLQILIWPTSQSYCKEM